VAYADFVTAMMAFFLLMWLLNATTEKQRKGIADFFNPTIPVNRISGGGEGAFGGDSVFSEEVLAQSGTGASNLNPTEDRQARGQTGADEGAASGRTQEEALREVEQVLLARGGESMTMERALRHVVTRITDEGLVVEMFDLEDAPLFVDDGTAPGQILHDLVEMIAGVFALVGNAVAVEGHVKSYPITLITNPVWDLSAARAQKLRQMLGEAGLATGRVRRVTGHADRKPVTPDPMAARNNRIELILLRRDR
jgi:chemotaxis protein MotB